MMEDDQTCDPEWRRLGAIDKTENILKLTQQVPHDSILETGAGDGTILENLSFRGFAKGLYAIDISKSGIERIQNKKIPGLIEALACDGYQIPHEDECFDIALPSHVVEYVGYPRPFIREATRIPRRIIMEAPWKIRLGCPTTSSSTTRGT